MLYIRIIAKLGLFCTHYANKVTDYYESRRSASVTVL